MSTIYKTNRDIRREDQAYITNFRLRGTGIRVTAGGGAGPYSVTIERLTYKQMQALIEIVQKADIRNR